MGRSRPDPARALTGSRQPGRRRLLTLCAAIGLGVVAGCAPDAGGSPAPAGPGGKSPKPRTHLVEFATISSGRLLTTSIYTGSLRYRQSLRVFNQEEGRLVALPYFEGDRVSRGEMLFELEGTILRAELDKARAVRREARANLERVKRLKGQRMVSAEALLRARTALEVTRAEERMLQARVDHTRQLAPFDGIVSARLAEPGDIIPRHTHLLTVVDPDSLVADLRVSELIIPHLTTGTAVEIRIDALGDQVYRGRVVRIHPELNARTRQGRVEIALDPVPDGARGGLFARVSFEIEALDRKIMSFSALRRDREGEYVYRIDAQSRARRTAVRGGRRQADRVEVLEGLEVGDQVVTRGFLGLSDGKIVTPVTGARNRATGDARG